MEREQKLAFLQERIHIGFMPGASLETLTDEELDQFVAIVQGLASGPTHMTGSVFREAEIHQHEVVMLSSHTSTQLLTRSSEAAGPGYAAL
jgi:hypothetical protein